MFLVLFRTSEANRGIYTDDPNGCQLILATSASASIVPFVLHRLDDLHAATLPMQQAMSYLHTLWLG